MTGRIYWLLWVPMAFRIGSLDTMIFEYVATCTCLRAIFDIQKHLRILR